jgi:hypothetical protein
MTKKLTDSESQAQRNLVKKKKWVGSYHNTSDIGYDDEWYGNDETKEIE